MIIKLTQSKLNLMQECPKCFYMQEHENFRIKRPFGMMSSIPITMDKYCKEVADRELSFGGVPLWEDRGFVADMRSHRRIKPYTVLFEDIDVEVIFTGELDDVAQDRSPLDFKASGKDYALRDLAFYYQTQADSYALLLEENGVEPSGRAYYFVVYPDGLGGWRVSEPHILEARPERAEELIERAARMLHHPDYPLEGEKCPICNYVNEVVTKTL